MILIWVNFNAQSFIHLKLSMQGSEHFFMSVHVRNNGGYYMFLWSVHSFTFICNVQLFWSNLLSTWLEAICRVLLSSFIKCFHSQIYSYNFSNLFHKGLPIFFSGLIQRKGRGFLALGIYLLFLVPSTIKIDQKKIILTLLLGYQYIAFIF